MTALYNADQVRQLDRTAIEDFSIPSYDLMSRAAACLLDIVQMRWPQARRILVVCGAGNNGGDGYVLARLLLEAGLQVTVLAAFDPARLAGDAKRAQEDFFSAGGESRTVRRWPEHGNFDLLVDGLFGSGLSRDVQGELAQIIKAINALNLPVLAIDVPSGLDASTGSVLGIAVRATVTLTFIGQKRGLVTNDGPDFAGQVFLDRLKVPAEVYEENPSHVFLSSAVTDRNLLKNRLRNSHKGSFADVLVVGGQYGMAGAVVLASEAAMRCGAGLVRMAVREKLIPHRVLPDVIRLDGSDTEVLIRGFGKAGVLAIGPGLGQSDWAKALLMASLDVKVPRVIDADGLNLLAHIEQSLDGNAILTPHPAEAARLLGTTTMHVQQDRFAAVEAIARKYNAIVVLKGCGSLISDGETTYVCNDGNPGMSCAGMGDVLTGIIAGLISLRMSVLEAAVLAVTLHARAGDQLYQQKGNGFLASDIIDVLPAVMMTFE